MIKHVCVIIILFISISNAMIRRGEICGGLGFISHNCEEGTGDLCLLFETFTTFI